jgi:hypothetical protein
MTTNATPMVNMAMSSMEKTRRARSKRQRYCEKGQSGCRSSKWRGTSSPYILSRRLLLVKILSSNLEHRLFQL